MKKWIIMCCSAIVSWGLFADDPAITDVTAQWENPWNGKVYISYKVTGDIAAIAKERGLITSLKVTLTDNVSNETYTATALSGDMSLSAGTHSLVWDMTEDGLSLQSSNVVFTVLCEKTPALYCVVDLSAGSSASSYPVTYLIEPPSDGFNTDEYKTTKLVLRRLEAGSFIMGENQTNESHRVTLSKPFYCGIFEVTQKQYLLVTGETPSRFSGDTLPVENVTYGAIRGSSDGAKWPASSAVDSTSFMGKLRARTVLDFDLPTEAQWEYACRARTTTKYSYGDSANGDYMWYNGNSSSTSHPVGTKIANPWGLYDMHGSVWEWCLDLAGTLTYGTDPKGATSGSDRVTRGGCWPGKYYYCASSYRNYYYPSNVFAGGDFGFRVVRTLPSVETAVTLCSGSVRFEPWGLSENLVAHYTFDGNANDTSGNGNDGVLHDVTATTDRHGNANSAYHFNGTSAYVVVPDSDSLREVGQTVTVSAWVKPEAWDNVWVSVLCKGYNEACRQYGPQIHKSGKWLLNYYNGTKANELQAKAIELNTWSHVSVTYTPTAITVYVDGERIGSMTPLGNMVKNSEPLYIGCDFPGGDEYLTGDMDEVRIYNRALSASEVRALYNNDNPVACNIDDGTWLYQYDVDDGVGVVWSGFGDVPSVLNIPESIDGKQVVQIGSYAFYDCTNLASVVLSNNIHTLTVGGNAFNASTTVTIVDRDGYEFMGWRNDAGRMVADPFHSGETVSITPVWRKVETAVIEGRTWTYAVIDGEAMIGIGSTAVSPAPDGDVAIPTEIGGYPVTGIASNAFKDCVGMTSLTISSNVTSVGIGAFDGCGNLVSVTMPWSLVTTMEATFPDAYDKLETVTLTGDTETIPNGAFSGCSSLRSIEIPDNVSRIGRQAFKNCGAIERLTIPSGKVIVEDGAFEGCNAIRSVVLPLDISRCGLVQAKLNVNNDFTSSIDDTTGLSKVSGVLMGYAYDTKTASKVFADPVYGGSYKWNVENTTFAYAGYMYMKAGRTYVFGKYFDDSVYVSVDGIEVLKNTDCAKFATGFHVPDFTGWHEIAVRVADGYGEKGPGGNHSGTHLWGANMGVGWRDDGITNAMPESGWHKLMDPGDGSLFRVEANMTLQELIPDSYMLVTNVVLAADSGGRIPANCCKGCVALVDVTIPSDVSHVGDGAFMGCTNLTNVMLPQSVGTLTVGMNAFDVATAIEIEARDGYVFCGWTNATGNVVADPFHSATANTVSPWWKKIVTIVYDANGGVGTMEAQTVLDGDDLPLASNAYTRVGYLFMGWNTEVGTNAEFADGQILENVDAAADGAVFYAVWRPLAPTVAPADGTTFQNASQTVTLAHDATDATILYTTDGSDPAVNGLAYKGPFAVYESCTIRAIARKAGLMDSEEAAVTLTRAEGLSEAANLYGYLMETDGGNPWVVVTDVSHDGVSCVRSGAIGHGGATWLQMSVRKAGTVSFWWKAACEEAEEEDGETYWYDYGSFSVDGAVMARIAGNDTAWRFVSIDVPSGGKHTFRWEYAKDGSTTHSPDCVWLDRVQWIPADGSGHTLTTPEPVPYSWLSGYGLGLDSDFETAARQSFGKRDDNGGAAQVWQDYVAGTDPTNLNSALTAMIAVRGGSPFVSWTPDLNTNGEVRVYTVFGKTNLTDAAWQSPTNSAHRFFKVKVEMP